MLVVVLFKKINLFHERDGVLECFCRIQNEKW